MPAEPPHNGDDLDRRIDQRMSRLTKGLQAYIDQRVQISAWKTHKVFLSVLLALLVVILLLLILAGGT